MSIDKAFPTVIIVGAQKSGTTSLYNWLAQHPDIFGNEAVKDFPYFSDSDINAKGIKTLQKYYTKASSYQHRLAGEANLMYVPGAIQRLSKELPEAKIIIVLREPVQRYISAWRYAVERGLEERLLEEAVEQELEVENSYENYSDAREQRQKDYLGHGNYSQQISEIMDCFSKKSVQVILYEELIENSDLVMKKLFEFLGVNESVQLIYSTKNKTLGGSKYRTINKLLYNKRPVDGFFVNLMRKSTSANFRAKIKQHLVKLNRKQQTPVSVSDETKIKLKEYYQSEVRNLKKLIDLNLKKWR